MGLADDADAIARIGGFWDQFREQESDMRMGSDDPCYDCDGKGWDIFTRGDGRQAVERCDTCQDVESFSDEDAAKLAQAAGIKCASEYPCYCLDEHGEPILVDEYGDRWFVKPE